MIDKTHQNGGAQPQPLMLKRTVRVLANANELIYCTEDGMYVGKVVFDCNGPAVLAVMGQDFARFVQEQLSGIALPGPGVAAALAKKP